MKIFLVGMPGSGKSYWGEALSEALMMPFFDLDEEIEKAEGMSIAYIFEKYGQDYFRELERQYLEELSTLDPAVIATGGGTPVFNDNMSWINQKGVSIFLNTPISAIISNLSKQDVSVRPLLKQHADNLDGYLNSVLQARLPYYEQAHFIINTMPKTAKDMAEMVIEFCNEFRFGRQT